MLAVGTTKKSFILLEILPVWEKAGTDTRGLKNRNLSPGLQIPQLLLSLLKSAQADLKITAPASTEMEYEMFQCYSP